VAECTCLLYFVVRVRCRRTESSRSLSHLLMSFLLRLAENLRRKLQVQYDSIKQAGQHFEAQLAIQLYDDL